MGKEKIDRGQGHHLSLDQLKRLKELVDKHIQVIIGGRPIKTIRGQQVSPEDVDEYLENPQSIKLRIKMIEKIPCQTNWIHKLAERMKVDPRSISKYVLDPERLDIRIEVLRAGRGEKRALQGEARQVFVEGVRLLSTTIDDLVRYIPGNFLRYRNAFAKVGDMPAMPKKVSRDTYNNEAKLCFDTTDSLTIQQMKADEQLQERVRRNLRNWEPGTVGVHAVQILWQRRHSDDRSNRQAKVTGGKMKLLLMAERLPGNKKEIGFSPIAGDATDEEKAELVKEFLQSLVRPPNLVRLTSELCGGRVVPTGVPKLVLEEILGNMVRVEVDEPTRGLGPVRVPGRFDSEDDLFRYLQILLD